MVVSCGFTPLSFLAVFLEFQNQRTWASPSQDWHMFAKCSVKTEGRVRRAQLEQEPLVASLLLVAMLKGSLGVLFASGVSLSSCRC